MPTLHRPATAGVDVLVPVAVVVAACSGGSGSRAGEGGRWDAAVDGSSSTGRVPESDVDDGVVSSPSSGPGAGDTSAMATGGAPPATSGGAGGDGGAGRGGASAGDGGAPGGAAGDGGAPGATSGDGSTSGSTADSASAEAASAQGSTADASAAQASSAEATSAATSTTGDASSSAATSTGSGGGPGSMSFFVTGTGNGTGDFGGLAGVDAFCQALAAAAGAGDRTWRAFVSTSAVDARDRIGAGPWYDAAGALVATDVPALLAGGVLHERALDENGAAVPNAVTAPGNNEHDILTGSTPGGTFSGDSCADWTSSSPSDRGTVGHCDASFTEGGGLSPVSPSDHWSSTHTSQGCDAASLDATGSTARVYCFAL